MGALETTAFGEGDGASDFKLVCIDTKTCNIFSVTFRIKVFKDHSMKPFIRRLVQFEICKGWMYLWILYLGQFLA